MPDTTPNLTARDRPVAREFGSLGWRAGNALASALARAGIGPFHLLRVYGRRTGRAHTLPVVLVEQRGRSWLVAPYGPVAWVRNTRAAGQVTLRRGRRRDDYSAREASPDEAGPVLKRYVAVATKTRAEFRAGPDAPVEEFIAEAGRHPVFELARAHNNAP
jgi:deazaflavin-dependent oxidoreductase (nitroreductase family)